METSMEAPSNAKLKISIKNQSGEQVYFNVRRNTKIVSLLRTYCHTKQLHYGSAIFLHNGFRLRRRGTAEQVGLEDGDEIVVTEHANGG